MADQDPHLDPKEATEAKLCAYLEGELSPSERIEIEQHLAANPQHRQLLVDLAKTRDWMRSIPRETSPVDLGEVFQGQVERAMLLDDSADQSTGMSINRWPQYALVAAITVLTLGLGVVLVAILKNPSQSGGSGSLAMKSVPSVSPTSAPSDEATRTRMADVSHAAALTPPVVPPIVATPADLQPAARLMGGRDRERNGDVDALKTKLETAGVRMPVNQKFVCFVVSADSPATTVEQVRGFFDRHQIASDVMPNDKSYSPLPGNGLGGGGGGVAFGNSRNNTENATVNEQNVGRDAITQNRQVAQQSPDLQLQGGALTTNNNSAASAGAAPASPTGETYYVARGVTPLQLELLNASLVSNDLKQKVERITLVDSPASDAAKALAPGAIIKGETITVTIPQLVGPGIEKVNVVKVADDGTITLPMIDPIMVAGESVGELQQRVADKYREANLITDATVTAVIAAPPAAPVAVAKAATTEATKDSPTSKPVTLAAAAPPPATQPASDLVDVVVVIQPSRFAAPAAPTTK